MTRVVRLAVACMVIARVAAAQPKTNADSLFADGQKLMDAKKIDEACEKFLQSLQLEPAMGTKLNLADCREKQNHAAEAYQLYVEVVDEATRTNKSSQLAFARQRLDALAPKVVRLTLQVTEPGLAGLVVRLGDRSLAPTDWAHVIAVEPGSIAISASATDREPFVQARDAKAGEQITLAIPALVVHAGAAPAPGPGQPARSLTPFIIGGSGAGVVLFSMIFALHAKSVYDDGSAQPAPMGDAKIHTAVVEANVCTALFVAGAVAVGVGTYLYMKERRTQIVPTSDGHGAGAAVIGRW